LALVLALRLLALALAFRLLAIGLETPGLVNTPGEKGRGMEGRVGREGEGEDDLFSMTF